MSRTRARSTPIPTQVKQIYREVAAEQGGVVSALRLEERINPPRDQRRRVTLNHIHQALHRLWAEGKLVAYYDEAGGVLRESTFGEPGSAAVAHPQIFGLPGSTLPEGAARAAVYQERHGPEPSPADRDAAVETRASGDSHAQADEEAQELVPCPAPDEAIEVAIRRYPEAPEWLDDALLARWLVSESVFRSFRAGLEAGPAQARPQLISTGMTRSSVIEPGLIRRLVRLCRRFEFWWQKLLEFAISDAEVGGDFGEAWRYLQNGAIGDGSDFDPATLPLAAFASEMSDDLVRVACEEALQEAEEVEEVSLVEMVDALQEQLNDERIEGREARREAQSLRRDLEKAEARANALQQRIDAQREDRAEEESQAESRLRTLESQLADVRDELADLAVERDGLAEENETLLEEQAAQEERLSAVSRQLDALERQRLDAEGKLQDAYGEQRALLARIRHLESDAGIPRPDDPKELGRYLSRAVSGISERALARLREGEPEEIDGVVLELAGEIARFTRRLAEHVPSIARDAEAMGGLVDQINESIEPSVVAETAQSDEALALEDPTPAQVTALPPEVEIIEAAAEDEAEPEPEPEPEPALAASSISDAAALARAIVTPRGTWTVDVLGGAQEVGASAILATAPSGNAVLLDCGQRVRGVYGDEKAPNLYHSRVTQSDRVQAIVVSHAHIDHIGSLPTLHPVQEAVQDAPIPIYMSSPSVQLTDLMLQDAAKVQAARAASARELADTDWAVGFDSRPTYGLEDVQAVMNSVEELFPYQRHTIPGTEITVELVPVPHILGACAVVLQEGDASLGYTGDLGPMAEPQLTLPTFNRLEAFPGVDVLVMEGTNGLPRVGEAMEARTGGARRERAIADFASLANRAIGRGGSVLVPAFALGRTQEVLRLLDERMGQDFPKAPIYIGGLGLRVCEVYEDRRHETMPGGSGWLERGPFARADNLARWMTPGEEFADVADRVLAAEPGYIVASPGMLGTGWSQTFAERMVDSPRHAIAHVGFIREPREIRNDRPFMCRDGRRLQVKAEAKRIALSAHASRQDLIAFAEAAARRRPGVALGLVHGDVKALRSLTDHFAGATSGLGEVRVLERTVTWRPTST